MDRFYYCLFPVSTPQRNPQEFLKIPQPDQMHSELPVDPCAAGSLWFRFHPWPVLRYNSATQILGVYPWNVSATRVPQASDTRWSS